MIRITVCVGLTLCFSSLLVTPQAIAEDRKVDKDHPTVQNAERAFGRHVVKKRGRDNPYDISRYDMLRATFRVLSTQTSMANVVEMVGDQTADFRILASELESFGRTTEKHNEKSERKLESFCKRVVARAQEVDTIRLGIELDALEKDSEKRWRKYFDDVLSKLSNAGRENLLRYAYEVVGPRTTISHISYSGLFADLPRETVLELFSDFCTEGSNKGNDEERAGDN